MLKFANFNTYQKGQTIYLDEMYHAGNNDVSRILHILKIRGEEPIYYFLQFFSKQIFLEKLYFNL